MTDYAELYLRSLNDPEGFWSEQAAAIDWITPWRRVLSAQASPTGRWFEGATLNTCHNALDRHIEAGRGAQPALIYDSMVSTGSRTLSFLELRDAVAQLAGAMRDLSVRKGDRVVIYMPMIPESVIGMLACARLGAIHSVVFGGFAAPELAARINDAAPRLILTASCGIESKRIVEYKPLLDAAIEMSGAVPANVLVFQRPECVAAMNELRDRDWASAVAAAEPADCVPVAATDTLYILYTSGTTGVPKGVVRDNGGHAVALCWTMRNIYGVEPGEVFWAASDIGWVVGHSYIVYAPLLNGNTTLLFEGKPVGTPDAGAFWRVIAKHKVSVLFTAPTAIRAIRREDPDAVLMWDQDLSTLRAVFLAGERSDPATLRWVEEALQIPVIDHWWQTETGWPVAANPLGIEKLPVKHGSTAVPMPGWAVTVLDEAGCPAAPGSTGDIVIRLPLPPGALSSLWNRDEHFRMSYLSAHPGFYTTSDAGFIDEDGYVHVMARTDDVINVAGHRLSTGAMEEILCSHDRVAEAAVFGISDRMKGQVPLGLVVPKQSDDFDRGLLAAELVGLVRSTIGPVADFKRVLIVDRLPKTRSGKILRATLSKIADGEAYVTPATIEDPAVLDEVARVMSSPDGQALLDPASRAR